MSDKVKGFMIGIFVAVGLLLVVGAVDTSPPRYGRYQISAWGGRFTENLGGVGVFVVDTTSGETRMAYARVYGEGKGRVVVDNLKRPFASMP